jgi:hypothetical protein
MKVGNIITFCLLLIVVFGFAVRFVIGVIRKGRNAEVVA